MIDVRGLTYGIALGVGAMFFLDPDRGAARRARIRDASKRLVHDVQHVLEVGTRDLENRTRGVGARARSALSGAERELSEDVLVARVRSRLGRVTQHAHAIDVRYKEGNEIELKGPALVSEHDRIVRAAARVRGVDSIDDDLVLYESPESVPGLQGGEGRPGGERMLPVALRAPGMQLLVGAAVAALIVSPLAPTFIKTLVFATMRRLLQDASPQVMKKVAERIGHKGNGAGKHEEGSERWGGAQEAR